MGGRSSNDFVEAVRHAGDIARLISDYVPLKQSGTRMKGLCPFHQEKTPSFSVDPSTQLFYCFGCQTGGDVFKFVMLYEKVGFREAVEMLAGRWGVPVPAASRPEDRTRERLRDMNREAETFFRRCLRDAEAGSRCRRYLERRGIEGEVAGRLGVGYAPDAWEALRTHLLSRGYKPREMIAGGLVLARKDGRGEYDRFRDRLVFPIRDRSGRTVAFGGRTLGDAEPKYVNSPETVTYVKGNHLYGLDLAAEGIRRQGFAIVVEGYLDLAALLQEGFENVVASLGTALTPEQARLLARYTDQVVVSYDGDAAGAQATIRSLDLLLSRGLKVRVAELPEKTDPDDFIRREGAAAYRGLLERAPGYLDFLIRREAATRDLSLPEEKVAAVNAVLPHLARLGSPIERVAVAHRLADALRIEDELVLQELGDSVRAGRSRMRQLAREETAVREVEAKLVSLLLRFPEARGRLGDEMEEGDLDGTRVSEIVRAVQRLHGEGEHIDVNRVFSALERDEDRDLLTRIAFRDEPEGRSEELEDCIRSLRRQHLVRERRRLQHKIEAAADPAALDALLVEAQRIARQIDALS